MNLSAPRMAGAVAGCLALVLLILAACAPPDAATRAAPTAAPDSQPTAAQNAPTAAVSAQQMLATTLGLTPNEVRILVVETRQWRNGCLELEKPGEMCTQAITPGYLVTLEANGKTYQYHTNETGAVVRAAGADATEPIIKAARNALMAGLGKAAAAAKAVTVEAVEWRDACLEIVRPDGACAQVITPGFRVLFEVNGRTHEVRTNQDGSLALLAPAAAGGAVLIWHREGGIAGFCDDLTITAAGAVNISSCKGSLAQSPIQTTLDSAQLAQLQTWLAQWAPLDYRMKDPAQADAMLQTLTFKGQGQAKAGDADIGALLGWVNQLHATLKGMTPPLSSGPVSPGLQVEPAQGGLASAVILRGKNWPAGQQINIYLASATVKFDPRLVVVQATVGKLGAFEVGTTIPAAWPDGAPISDAMLTWVASTPDGAIKATADFSVIQ